MTENHKWLIGIAIVIVALLALYAFTAEATPATPGVVKVGGQCEEVTLKFTNTTNSRAQFEYRIDGAFDDQFPGKYFQEFIGDAHPVVGGTVYPQVTLDNRDIAEPNKLAASETTETFTADSLVEVRLALGGERDWDFDWVEFPVEACPTPTPSQESKDEGDESSTQDTNCADLASLTEEQALNDCGESKHKEEPKAEKVAPKEPVKVDLSEDLKVLPSTGFSIF